MHIIIINYWCICNLSFTVSKNICIYNYYAKVSAFNLANSVLDDQNQSKLYLFR